MKISVGMDSFAKLRTNNCYYVDKTEFIETLLNESFEAMLFTRPRRFGKTLMMSMLAEFFDISKDNHVIFQDLSIYKNKPLCAEWMNQYPVIFLTLKAVEGLNFQSAYAMFEFLIAEWCISHRFLLESEKLTELDKEIFEKFMKKTAKVSELKNSLYTLSRLMTMHYGKNTIILIDEYDVLHSSEENLWSILYLTGYLTQVNSVDDTQNFYQQTGKTLLKIPNEEIKTIFAETIATWFSDNIKELDRTPMFDAFWEGKDEKVSQFVTDLLFETISYYDYKEDYYHAFLTGIFTGAGYIVESNREYGLGRPDIVVKDKKNRRVLIIEIKHSKNELQMSVDVKKALKQIDVKQYAKTFLKGYRTILCYGAAFFEKECIIRKI